MSVPVAEDVDNVSSNKVRASGEKGYIQLSDGVGNFRSNRYFTFDQESTPKHLEIGIQNGGILCNNFLIGNSSNPSNNTPLTFEGTGIGLPGIRIFDGELQMDSPSIVRPKPSDDGNFGEINWPLPEENLIPGFRSGHCEFEAAVGQGGNMEYIGGDSNILGNGGDINITAGKGLGAGNNNEILSLEGVNTYIGLEDFGVPSIRGDLKIITDGATYIMPKNTGAVNDRITIEKIEGNIVTLTWAPP